MEGMSRGFQQALIWVTFCVIPAPAQTPAANTLGVVTKVDSSAHQILLKTDAGAEVTINLQPNAGFRRVAPGETNLANASKIELGDINAGDRLLARGKPSDDQKSVQATLVVVMSKSDIANKQAEEKSDWDKRGVSGVVTAVGSDQITITARGPGGAKPLAVIPDKDLVVRRYAPDSIKFADAKPSSLGEIKVGDQIRARGDKSPDGAKLMAEEIVAGSFRTIAATVTSIDGAENRLKVTNLDGKKPVTIRMNPDSSMRKLPPQMAQMLAARNRPGEEGAGGRSGAAFPVGAGSGRGPGGGRGGDLQQVVDRSPKITIADLKAGDAIIVLSTAGATPDQVTAITLVAGVEPILTAPGRKEMALGDWSLGVDAGGGQ